MLDRRDVKRRRGPRSAHLDRLGAACSDRSRYATDGSNWPHIRYYAPSARHSAPAGTSVGRELMWSVTAHVSGVKTSGVRAVVAAILLLSLPFAASAQGMLGQKKGEGGSEIQGSAGPGGSQGSNGLEHCDKPMGALAVVEPQDYVSQSLSRYGLQSPTGLIRMMVQQSNCFIVVERGIGMQNMMQERALQESGELRQNSNMGGGQMVSADFVLTPAVVFSENDSGGIGGALGGLLPGSKGRALGAVAGGLKFKEAQTSMLVTDARSGVQVASA